MKKRIGTITILTVLLLTGLTSCGNLFSGKKAIPSPVASKITLSGKLLTEGALPHEIFENSSSTERAAFPLIEKNNLTFEVTATRTLDGFVTEGTVSEDSTSFTIEELDEQGNYTIRIVAKKDDTVVIEGSQTLTVTKENCESVEISLEPASVGTGSIDLAISTGEVEVNKIVWSLDNETPVTIENLSSVKITIPEVACGAHKLYLKFIRTVSDGTHSADIMIYDCKEAVNVLPGLTTDTWIRTASLTDIHLAPITKPADMDIIDYRDYLLESGETVFPGGKATFELSSDYSDIFINSQIYVSSTGNDTTGTGSVFKPYKTITKAIEKANTIPTGLVCTSIMVEPGFSEKLEKDIVISDTSFHMEIYDFSFDQTDQEKGPEYTIDTNGHSIILDDSTEVTFSQITFTNSADESPVIVTHDSASTLCFENCSFTNTMDSYHSVITTKGKLILKELFAFDQNQFITISDSNIITLDTSFTTGDGQIPLSFTDITEMRGKSPFTDDSDVQKTDSFTIYGNDNYYLKDDGTIALVSLPASGTITCPAKFYDDILIQIEMDMDEDGNTVFPILFLDLTGNPLDDVVITKVIVDCAGENPESSENTWKLVDTVLVFSPEFMLKIVISNVIPGIYAFFTYNGQPYSAYLPLGY